MTKTIEVLGLSGSLRRNSYNTALLGAAVDLAPAGMEITVATIGDLPLFNVDLEEEGAPEPVAAFGKAMSEADALLIATPEYNWSTTGTLKNALDWASRGGADSPLTAKPAAILGAGGRFGTLRAQLHLREILGHNRVRLVESPQVFVDSPGDKFDDDLRLVHERTRNQVTRLLDALAELVRGAEDPA